MTKYAVISINRQYGTVRTVRVLTDAEKAQRAAVDLDRLEPHLAHAVVPYEPLQRGETLADYVARKGFLGRKEGE